VEVDSRAQVLPVPEAPRRVFTHWILGIDWIAGRIRDPIAVRDEFSNRRLSIRATRSSVAATPHCPVVPPAEVFPRRTFVDVAV